MKPYFSRLFSLQGFSVVLSIIAITFACIYKEEFIKIIKFPWLTESLLVVLLIAHRIQRLRYGQIKNKVLTKEGVKESTLENLIKGKPDLNTKNYPDIAALCAAVYPSKNYPIPSNWERISDKIKKQGGILGKLGEDSDIGFNVHVYLRKDDPLIVIVFRGTVGKSWKSWVANLNWLTRILPYHNHYSQTAEIVPEIVKWCNSHYEDIPIVSAGHSLGGGLAQLANYISSEIKHTYAINSSPVTGWFDVKKENRELNIKGSRIYRMYEKGEVLELVRPIAEFWYFLNPAPNINPIFIEHRVNLGGGWSITEHSIESMANELMILQQKYK